MCAIFQLAWGDEAELRAICAEITRKYGGSAAADCLNHDIYPGGTAMVSGGPHKAAQMRWGFPLPGSNRPVFNARAESLARRPLFRTVLGHRCLVPATAFYEFDRAHRRHRIALPQRRFFYLAGLWMAVHGENGTGFCFTVITTAPNPQIGAFHDRMPAILTPQTAPVWLSGAAESLAVLRPLPEPMNIRVIEKDGGAA